MEFLLPIVFLIALVLVPVGFLMARRDSGKGAHPGDLPGHRE